ncbi:MAG TPA: hypothetical protein DGD08_14125 [Gemmatimonas aurantiaca]|uniref:Uncharacterized protein n=2 Tax=Gemmatimonas aurantiaca TaxID=173480 RepID=A0A3D4VDC5_9BACT|nr:hypothetical protein [Gemmatimonas aurantiaca]HCT58337.1 hypothetical protein [Gemmatimonas aurantiaca]
MYTRHSPHAHTTAAHTSSAMPHLSPRIRAMARPSMSSGLRLGLILTAMLPLLPLTTATAQSQATLAHQAMTPSTLSLIAPSGSSITRSKTSPIASPATADTTAVTADHAAAVTAQPVALRTRAVAPAEAPRAPHVSKQSSSALMIVGFAAMIVGAVVDGDAGTLIMVGGAGVGLYGLYHYLN